MIVEVTQEDINKGVPGEPCNCPVALAIKRKQHKTVIVAPRYFYFLNDCTGDCIGDHAEHRYDLPGEIYYWISAFDDRLPVEPVTFEVSKGRKVAKW